MSTLNTSFLAVASLRPFTPLNYRYFLFGTEVAFTKCQTAGERSMCYGVANRDSRETSAAAAKERSMGASVNKAQEISAQARNGPTIAVEPLVAHCERSLRHLRVGSEWKWPFPSGRSPPFVDKKRFRCSGKKVKARIEVFLRHRIGDCQGVKRLCEWSNKAVSLQA
jgi:hypothetical protein